MGVSVSLLLSWASDFSREEVQPPETEQQKGPKFIQQFSNTNYYTLDFIIFVIDTHCNWYHYTVIRYAYQFLNYSFNQTKRITFQR